MSERIKWYKKNKRNKIFKKNLQALNEFNLNNISEVFIKNNFKINIYLLNQLRNHKFINQKNKIKFIISSLPLSNILQQILKYFYHKF